MAYETGRGSLKKRRKLSLHQFREGNHVFDDLYVEIDKYERIPISDFAIGRRSENDA